MKKEYQYQLSDKQWLAANHFAEAYESLHEAGIKIILEEDTGTLCLINGKGVTFEYAFFNCIQENDVVLDMQNVHSDNIYCLSNDIISVSPGDILLATNDEM